MSAVDELKPEALEYKIFTTLEGEHSMSITCVAFSPDGYYLACGGEDNKMTIWDASSAEILHVLTGVSPVLCISWLNSEQLVVGMGNGGLACTTVDKASSELSVSTFTAHASAVVCVDSLISEPICATGAKSDISIWKYDGKALTTDLLWTHVKTLPPPSSSNHYSDAEMQIASLRWGGSRRDLVVAYFGLGVVLWDTLTDSANRCIRCPQSRIVSLPPPDGNNEPPQQVAVSDKAGFKIFSLGSATLLGTYQDKNDQSSENISSDRSLPALHIHDGNALLGGSSVGRAHLWDIASSKQKVIQVLRHPDALPITSLAAYYDYDEDTFFIATVTNRPDGTPVVYVWRTQDNVTPHEIALTAGTKLDSYVALNTWNQPHPLVHTFLIGVILIGCMLSLYVIHGYLSLLHSSRL